MSSQTRLTFLLQWKKTYSGKMCFLTIQQKSKVFGVVLDPTDFLLCGRKKQKTNSFSKISTVLLCFIEERKS